MPLRLAQYGIAHAHAAGKAKVMQENPEVELAGVFEPDPALRAGVGSQDSYAGVHWFATPEEFLEDDSIVGVAVEGRVRDNLRFAREVLEHGKHVWLDKPAGEDLEEFRALLALAQERELLVQLGYMFRYNAGFQFIVDWARSGRLGDLFAVRGRMSTQVSEETREELAFHQGGILFELLGHLLDSVVYLLGRPHRVTSFLRNDLGTVPGFRDNTILVMEFDRAVGHLESAAMEQNPFPARRFEVYGTRGSAILVEEDLTYWRFDDEAEEDARIRAEYGGLTTTGGGAGDPAAISYEGHRQEFANFLAALDEGREPFPDGREARKAVEVILGIYESARSKRIVSLPL